MQAGKPLFLRRIEINHIQTLLAKRGKSMDWMIIKDMDNEIGTKFNPRTQETSTKDETVFIRQRELDHILHHLYLDRTDYSRKIMGLIVEQTGISYIITRGCFTDYNIGGERADLRK
jgi:hypothetical protein